MIEWNRRDFIAFLGGGSVIWPLAARAQQTDRVRRIGVLMSMATGDPEGRARIAAFLQALQQLSWTDLRIETRWSTGSADDTRKYAELVALAPDVIPAAGSATLGPLLQATRAVPIVFVHANRFSRRRIGNLDAAVGVFMSVAADDPEGRAGIAAFLSDD